jgi:MFS family permease
MKHIEWATAKLGFITSQPKNWKVTATRASLDKVIYQMLFPYLSIYIVGLGGGGTRLGLANGIGMAISALYGLLGAFFIRGFGPKRTYLTGLLIVALSYASLGIAHSWVFALIGMVLWWLGSTEAGLCCNVVCGSSLENRTRATAMSCCESVAQGAMSFLGPVIGALLIGLQGGLSLDTIRPLFFIAALAEIGVVGFVKRNLAEAPSPTRRQGRPAEESNPFLILKRRKGHWKFIAVTCLATMPTSMVLPFVQVYAREAKFADPYTLSAMATAASIVSLFVGIPLGRFADRIGRKKVLYIIAPLFWASNILLISTSSPIILVVSAVLQGVFPVTIVLSGAMSFEQVPAEDMSDWMAVSRFFRMLTGAILAFVSGLAWDYLGRQWVFLLVTGIDALIRLPLLISMPETLGRRPNES